MLSDSYYSIELNKLNLCKRYGEYLLCTHSLYRAGTGAKCSGHLDLGHSNHKHRIVLLKFYERAPCTRHRVRPYLFRTLSPLSIADRHTQIRNGWSWRKQKQWTVHIRWRLQWPKSEKRKKCNSHRTDNILLGNERTLCVFMIDRLGHRARVWCEARCP